MSQPPAYGWSLERPYDPAELLQDLAAMRAAMDAVIRGDGGPEARRELLALSTLTRLVLRRLVLASLAAAMARRAEAVSL
ncbi:hypothetical protein ACIGXM_06410 [Kitasatospora sp. NPDC052896]|uniref:hypothetical protein n=1 Tax=Kitasatospora sp. NPDC052896 TaxID=3364061 RepID=UPI0037C8BDEB